MQIQEADEIGGYGDIESQLISFPVSPNKISDNRSMLRSSAPSQAKIDIPKAHQMKINASENRMS